MGSSHDIDKHDTRSLHYGNDEMLCIGRHDEQKHRQGGVLLNEDETECVVSCGGQRKRMCVELNSQQ